MGSEGGSVGKVEVEEGKASEAHLDIIICEEWAQSAVRRGGWWEEHRAHLDKLVVAVESERGQHPGDRRLSGCGGRT